MKCANCEASNLDGADRCSSCGESLEVGKESGAQGAGDSSRSTWIIGGVILAAVAVFAGLMLSSGLGAGGGGGGGVSTATVGYSAAPEVARTGSDSAVGTAIALSREGWPAGSRAAVLYSVEDSAAAAVAGPLATVLDAPVLLASSGTPEPEVLARLAEMQTATVYVLDSGANTAGYAAALQGAGIGVDRVAAAGPAALSSAVAGRINGIKPINGVLVVAAGAEQRAVLAGGYAGAMNLPVLIVDRPDASAFSGIAGLAPLKTVIVCASTAQVPDSTFLGGQFAGALVDRLDEADDHAFAKALAEYAYAHGFEYRVVFAVQARHVRHSYALAPLSARSGSSLILTGDDQLGDAATSFFLSHASAITNVRFVGPADPSVDALLATARQASETRISSNAYPLDDTTAAKVSAVSTDTVTFTADPSLEATLTVGKIIVSGISPNAPEGFLRQITAVRNEGGSLVVETSQASLSDVIMKGSFDVRVSGSSIGPQTTSAYPAPVGEVIQASFAPGAQAPESRGPELIQTSDGSGKYEADHIKVPADWPAITYESPAFDLPPELGEEGKFEVKLDANESWETWYVISGAWEDQPVLWGLANVDVLTEFGIVAYMRHNYEMDYEISLELSSSAKAEGRSALPSCIAQKLGGKTDGKEISFTSAFTIGPVPVVLVSYVAPYVGFEGTVKGTLKGHYEKNVEAWVGAKVRLDSGKVTPVVGVADRSPDIALPTLEGEVESKFSAGLKIGTRFYGVVGPYMRGEMYFKGTYKSAPPPSEHPMVLKLGVEGAIGGDLKIVVASVTVFDAGSVEFDPISKDFWEWPEPGTPVPAPPAIDPPQPGDPGGGGGGGGWGSSDVATVIVIDASGSMSESSGSTTKLGAAQDAGHVLLDLLEGYLGSVGDVSVVAFADDAMVMVPATTDEDEIRAAIDSLSSGGMTNIYAGLRTGVDELTGASATDKAIFFLSDGLDTVNNDPADIVEVAEEAGDAGIDIITIGFGDSGNLDEDLLTEIAEATPNGEYSRVDPSVAVGLIGQFASSQVARSGANVLYETVGSVSEGETVAAGGTTVPPEYGNLEVVLAWPGSDMDVILTDPSGAQLTEGYPGLTITKTERTAQVKVEGAKPGEWKFDVHGIETSMDDEPFFLLAAHRETTGTPAPGGGGGGTTGNDGSALLIALLGMLGVGGVSWVVLASRKGGAAGDGPVDPLAQLGDVRPTAAAPAAAIAGAQAASGASVGEVRRVSSAVSLMDEIGTRYPLAVGANALGRATDNDIVLPAPTVSRHHAMIVVSDAGVRVKDLGSSAGTTVNAVAVQGTARAVAGDKITVGDVRLTVEAGSELLQ